MSSDTCAAAGDNQKAPAESGADGEFGRERAMQLYEEQRRAFQAHAAGFAIGMVVMFVTNLAINLAAGIAGHWSAWWSAWALLGWSIGIAVHGCVVWLNQPTHSATRGR